MSSLIIKWCNNSTYYYYYYCPYLLGGRHCAKDISYVSSFDYQNKSNVRYYYNPQFIDLILQSYKNFKLSSRIKFSICTKVKQVKKTLFKATAIGERVKN